MKKAGKFCNQMDYAHFPQTLVLFILTWIINIFGFPANSGQTSAVKYDHNLSAL
jgi:hypothetical protein